MAASGTMDPYIPRDDWLYPEHLAKKSRTCHSRMGPPDLFLSSSEPRPSVKNIVCQQIPVPLGSNKHRLRKSVWTRLRKEKFHGMFQDLISEFMICFKTWYQNSWYVSSFHDNVSWHIRHWYCFKHSLSHDICTVQNDRCHRSVGESLRYLGSLQRNIITAAQRQAATRICAEAVGFSQTNPKCVDS